MGPFTFHLDGPITDLPMPDPNLPQSKNSMMVYILSLSINETNYFDQGQELTFVTIVQQIFSI